MMALSQLQQSLPERIGGPINGEVNQSMKQNDDRWSIDGGNGF